MPRIAPAHDTFDQRAIFFGHRYRSGYWAIYLLSAVAVLFAVVPLALGWDDSRHMLHPYVGLWAVGELCIILTVAAIYWKGHRSDWQGQWLRARTTAELTWYLPLIAPLVDFTQGVADNWYARVLDPGQELAGGDDLAALCAKNESLARAVAHRRARANRSSSQAMYAGPSRSSRDSGTTIIASRFDSVRCCIGCTVSISGSSA